MVYVLTRCIIDTSFLCRGCWTYVISWWIFSLSFSRRFHTESIVLPLTYVKSYDVFKSIRYCIPVLYWVKAIAISSVFLNILFRCSPVSYKMLHPVVPILFLNEWNFTSPNSFCPPLIWNAVFLLYPHFAMIFGNAADSIFYICLSVKNVYPKG